MPKVVILILIENQRKEQMTHLGFVMAMPAIKYLITARCSDLASSSVMWAPDQKHGQGRSIES